MVNRHGCVLCASVIEKENGSKKRRLGHAGVEKEESNEICPASEVCVGIVN